MPQENKEKVKCIYLIPFYDKDIKQLYDTVDSILYYSHGRYKIICVNDCQEEENIKNVEKKLARPEIEIFTPQYNSGWPVNTYGSLFCKQYQGIEFAINNFEFDFLIGMDTDALITGFDLFNSISNYFKTNDDRIGLIGSYRIRSDGKKRTRWQWALFIIFLTYFKRSLSKKTLVWKEWIPKARKNGYKLGEHVLGGAFVYRYRCIRNIIELYPYQKLLDDHLYRVEIGDDVLFSLITFACNFTIGDFGCPDDPLSIAQNYLPIRKEDIIKKQKQIIHSVKKGLHGESEDELRAYFCSIRKIGHS